MAMFALALALLVAVGLFPVMVAAVDIGVVGVLC